MVQAFPMAVISFWHSHNLFNKSFFTKAKVCLFLLLPPHLSALGRVCWEHSPWDNEKRHRMVQGMSSWNKMDNCLCGETRSTQGTQTQGRALLRFLAVGKHEASSWCVGSIVIMDPRLVSPCYLLWVTAPDLLCLAGLMQLIGNFCDCMNMTGEQWAERDGWALHLKGRISPWVRTKACHVDWGKAEERTVNSDCAFLIVWTLWKEGFPLVHWGLPCALISAHGQYSSSPTFSSAGSRDIYRSIAQGKVMDVQRCWVPSAASQNNQLN